jgi:hypothetical protein
LTLLGSVATWAALSGSSKTMIRKSVAEILDDHVTFELEAIDRMYRPFAPSRPVEDLREAVPVRAHRERFGCGQRRGRAKPPRMEAFADGRQLVSRVRDSLSIFRAGHPRLAALLLAQIQPVFSLVAPRQPGAALRKMVANL